MDLNGSHFNIGEVLYFTGSYAPTVDNQDLH